MTQDIVLEEEIQVTYSMVKAGVDELHEHAIGENAADIVTAVYVAMEYERRDPGAKNAIREEWLWKKAQIDGYISPEDWGAVGES